MVANFKARWLVAPAATARRYGTLSTISSQLHNGLCLGAWIVEFPLVRRLPCTDLGRGLSRLAQACWRSSPSMPSLRPHMILTSRSPMNRSNRNPLFNLPRATVTAEEAVAAVVVVVAPVRAEAASAVEAVVVATVTAEAAAVGL